MTLLTSDAFGESRRIIGHDYCGPVRPTVVRTPDHAHAYCSHVSGLAILVAFADVSTIATHCSYRPSTWKRPAMHAHSSHVPLAFWRRKHQRYLPDYCGRF